MPPVPISKKYRYEPVLEKPLPQNLDAERSVLGAILIENAALAKVRELIVPLDFASDDNRKIYTRMARLAEKSEAIDLVTLSDEFQSEGEREQARLAAVAAQLLVGMQRVTNVEHYAKIVREKSTLRQLIHATHAIQADAFDAGDPAEEIMSRAIGTLATINTSQQKDGLKICDVRDFLSMDLPPVTYLVEPILQQQGITMVHSWRGVGKTNFCLEGGYCVALGEPRWLAWPIPEARPVVYVDGEMDAPSLQQRLREIAAGHKSKGLPPENQFRLITPDLQHGRQPNISTRDGQRRIEDFLTGRGELIFFDNLSSLCPSDEESELEIWIMVQSWLLSLRRRGYTSVFLHHSGKGGTQRGWSGREDLINVTLNLRSPANYEREEGLRLEVHIEKLRGKNVVGSYVQPFEAQMLTENGAAFWAMRPLREMTQKQAFEMFSHGDKDRDVCEILRLSRHQVYRLRRKWEKEKNGED